MLLPKTQTQSPFSRWRLRREWLASAAIGVGGVTVIIAILLIFLYLAYTVMPLFAPATIRQVGAGFAAPTDHPAVLLVDDEGQRAAWVLPDGQLHISALPDGALLQQAQLPLPPGETVVKAVARDNVLAMILSGGDLMLARLDLNDVSGTSDGLSFPWGAQPFEVAGGLRELDMVVSEQGLLLALQERSGRLQLMRLQATGGNAAVTRQVLPQLPFEVDKLRLSADENWLFASDLSGGVNLVTLAESQPRFVEHRRVIRHGQITAMALLSGGQSLLLGTSDGRVLQWFPLLDENANPRLQDMRQWTLGERPVTHIQPEQFRKSFTVLDAAGRFYLLHATAGRQLLDKYLGEGSDRLMSLSAHGEHLLLLNPGRDLQHWQLHNPHPEISFAALWQQVWYEGFRQPQYLWQSSSGSSDYEPKFSLSPLTFGTLKAAFYAMLFAMPLAIFGAVYTAYFLSPRMRELIKPSIEIMEALPTVILGLLAGLWLAPLLEQHLVSALALVLLLPVMVLLFGFGWQQLTRRADNNAFGWQVVLLIPVIVLTVWLSSLIGAPLETLLFDGNLRGWLEGHGIDYNQRNALVVGIAMGFAVVPTIFSITEDAVVSVPGHLVRGSLALGATHWQTLMWVVLPTASPAIFSALMIGFGRAIGETMIVLMATGNTPIMDFDLFNGMRTLAANIAVEMPESEVGSSHYRVLFLAALVLLIFTFALNTVAEMIRYRLRRRYSQL